MGRSGGGVDIHGIVLLDKPAGRSSNHALQDRSLVADSAIAEACPSLGPCKALLII